jgi:hypothetical protein
VLIKGSVVACSALVAAIGWSAPPNPSTGPTVDGYPVFPADNSWNQDISALPLHSRSDRIIAKIQSVGGNDLHPDVGENPNDGVPYVVVDADQQRVPIAHDAYGDERDPGLFPVPLDARVEGVHGAMSGTDSNSR